MPSSTIESRILRLLCRHAEARVARAGEFAARARRDASAASDELGAARSELARLELEIAGLRKALESRLAQSATGTQVMNRTDFARYEHAYKRVVARRSNAYAAIEAAKKHLDVMLATLAECEDTQRKRLRQREKYRLAEKLWAGAGIEDAVGPSSPALSTLSPMPATSPIQVS